MRKKFFILILIILACNTAFAFSAPNSSTTAYKIYDIYVNKLLYGGVRYGGGLLLVCNGIYNAVVGKYGVPGAITSIVSGGILAATTYVANGYGFLM